VNELFHFEIAFSMSFLNTIAGARAAGGEFKKKLSMGRPKALHMESLERAPARYNNNNSSNEIGFGGNQLDMQASFPDIDQLLQQTNYNQTDEPHMAATSASVLEELSLDFLGGNPESPTLDGTYFPDRRPAVKTESFKLGDVRSPESSSSSAPYTVGPGRRMSMPEHETSSKVKPPNGTHRVSFSSTVSEHRLPPHPSGSIPAPKSARVQNFNSFATEDPKLDELFLRANSAPQEGVSMDELLEEFNLDAPIPESLWTTRSGEEETLDRDLEFALAAAQQMNLNSQNNSTASLGGRTSSVHDRRRNNGFNSEYDYGSEFEDSLGIVGGGSASVGNLHSFRPKLSSLNTHLKVYSGSTSPRSAANLTPRSSVTTPRSSHTPKNATSTPGTPTPGMSKRVRRKPKTYMNKDPSTYCHVCARDSRRTPAVICGNFGQGVCRKVVCKLCFDKLCWDFDQAAAESSGWLCSHCTNSCPNTARCHIYDRINAKRIKE